MDENEYGPEVESQPVESIEWQWSFAAFLGAQFAHGISEATTSVLEAFQHRLASHHNWLVDQRTFAEEARLAIETLPGTDD